MNINRQEKQAQARTLRAEGRSIRQIARELGCGIATVYRLLEGAEHIKSRAERSGNKRAEHPKSGAEHLAEHPEQARGTPIPGARNTVPDGKRNTSPDAPDTVPDTRPDAPDMSTCVTRSVPDTCPDTPPDTRPDTSDTAPDTPDISTTDPLQNVLSRLAGVKRTRSGHDARCPAHDDKHASLSVSLGDDGRVLLHCHAGCVLLDICQAIGLRIGDLFPRNNSKSSRISAIYDYTDAGNNLLYQVVRFEPKSFRQRRPDGNGGWIWRLNNTPRVLYRLSELNAATPESWVYIVEGEKDADRLASLGLIATTCPQGAGKWNRLSDDSVLHGKRAAIIADKDAAGRKHAADIALRLQNRAADIRVIELPGDGNDVSDWFDAGGTTEKLLDIVEHYTSDAVDDPDVSISSSSHARIQGNERQLRDIRSDAITALVAANDPPHLFTRSGGIARVALINNNEPQIQQLDADAVRGELTNAADWFTLKHSERRGDYLLPDLPPLSIARDLLALPSVELPPLNGIITCPAFAGDGSLILDNGYHGASGLWHHRTLTSLPEIPKSPSQQQIATARETIADIFCDFPFVDDASRANTYALTILPFVRHLIDGPTPLHASDAPTPATGKDLLAKTALLPALGYLPGVTTAAKDADEWRKKITSELTAGRPAIVWGNITYRLDSEHLAAVLTETTWSDRVLGQTRVITLPNLAVWVATGNNLTFSKELARRVVWIRLDARIEAPEQRRGFKHPDLLQHIRSNRGKIVHAALTLAQAWLAADRPSGKQVMGSFESYVAVVGGILDVAGIEGFLGNADELRKQADTETGEWRAFVSTWWDRWHDSWIGVKDLAGLLWTDDGKRSDLLVNIINSERERGVVTQLGRRLSTKRDCVVGGYRVVVGDSTDRKGRLAYRLVPEGNEGVRERNLFDSATLDQSADLCRLNSEVGTEVGTRKSFNSATLEQSADLRRLFPVPYACGAGVPDTSLDAPLYIVGGPEKSAGVGITAHPVETEGVKSADFPADLVPTSSEVGTGISPPENAAGTTVTADESSRDTDAAVPTTNVRRDDLPDNVPPSNTRRPTAVTPTNDPDVSWYEGDDLPDEILGLVQRREGWSPPAWHYRLLQLAERCERIVPERAEELRTAARVMRGEGMNNVHIRNNFSQAEETEG